MLNLNLEMWFICSLLCFSGLILICFTANADIVVQNNKRIGTPVNDEVMEDYEIAFTFIVWCN